jgi:formylglycine-generating enzyme required for sulfatase activity/tRNA A-37 threonylcarbamoyl transferase component Bud32
MIAVTCPGCSRTLSVKDAYAGKTGTCPHCKARIKVPTTASTDATVGAHGLADEATLPPPASSPSLPAVASDRLDFLAPPQGPGEIGRLGPYRVLKLLGAGGMGMVLQAEDPMLKRTVALKVMRPELAAAADARERFLREAQATAAIEHPHIIHVYQVAEDRGVPYLAMPFLKGEPLDEYLKRRPRLPVNEAVSLGRQIAEGLAAAHAAGLIHRDIKPGNVFLVSGGGVRGEGSASPGVATPGLTTHHSPLVKILDFGLARARTGDDVNLTKTGAILGTPAYMSPEQARGEKADHRSDLFSLGAVLYRMLAGEQPFKGNDTLSLLMALATEEPRSLRELNPQVPPALAELVMQLLAKDPAKRPASARGVAEELASFDDTNTAAYRSASRRGSKSRSRWLLPVAGSACLGLIVLALVFFLRPSGKKGKEPPDTLQSAFPDPAGTVVNSLGMKMVPIQPGQFWMGSPKGEPGRNTDESEHVIVLTKPFFIGMHEVTVGQFAAFVKDTGHLTDAEKSGEGAYRLMENGKWAQEPKTTWRNPGFAQTDDHPVTCVSRNDAQAFCFWLTGKEGKKYVLPTEAQWEYCCRAGSRSRFSFGDDEGELDAHGWFAGNSAHTTYPVGQKKPNAWGLFDMHGNVQEWCDDWYASNYYVNSPREDPRCPRGLPPPPMSVIRGGGWWQAAEDCRSACRKRQAPPNKSATNVGFRVAMGPQFITTSAATGMTLRLIHGGKFPIGSPGNEFERRNDEALHEVHLRPFWIGRHEVTVGQFKLFVSETGYRTDAEKTGEGSDRFISAKQWKRDPAINWRSPGFAQTDDHPAVCVSWNDAMAFCDWLSKKEGKRYSLPTEAQWEFCCRSGRRTRFFAGNDEKALDRHGWYEKNAEMKSHPVGQKKPNNWDLYDMHGDAWEWCSDWYAPAYGRTYLDPPGPTDGTARVLRGGGWASPARICRSAMRVPHEPSQRNSNIGFRVVQLPELVQTNSIGMKLALVPVGTFTMGSPGNEPFHGRDEDQHEVSINRPFYIGAYKVTVGQFKAFVKETGFQTEAEKTGQGAYGFTPDLKPRMDPKMNWLNPGFQQTDDHPVVCVNLNDARAFCAWLSKREGRYYTLPTEAQWEFACRAGTRSRYFFGNDEKLLKQYAWYNVNSGKTTHPVGQLSPNPLGLYDMYGNTTEMVTDWYAADYFRKSPRDDPPGPSERVTSVRRGGSWRWNGRDCVSARRHGGGPPSARSSDAGFRVVLVW